MDTNLQQLIDLAKQHTITQAEHQAQVRSFAYGNSNIEDPSITKADIDGAMTTLQANCES